MQEHLTVKTTHVFTNIDGTQVIVDQWNDRDKKYTLILDGYPEYEPPIVVDCFSVSGGGEYVTFRNEEGELQEANFNNIISIHEFK